jgi:hypothetical protein
LSDFSLFSEKYGLGSGDPGNEAIYDLDSNGFIGMGNWSIFSDLYGTTYSYSSGGAIPEPAIFLAVASGLAILIRDRRKSR